MSWRAGNKEILLFQPQLFALDWLVVGVENLGDVLRENLFVDCPVVVAHVESFKFKGLHSFSLPQPKQIAGVYAIPQDRGVVGNALHSPVGNPSNPVAALIILIVFGAPPKTHLKGDFRSNHFPWIAQSKPVVGAFHLPAVSNLLLEDAEFVADTVANGRDLESCKGIEVAGRQPAQPSITKARLLLLVEEGLDVLALLLGCPSNILVNTQVYQVVLQMGTEEELSREISDNLDVLSTQLIDDLIDGLDPAVHQLIPDGVGESHIEVVSAGTLHETPLRVKDVIAESASQALDTHV